MFSLLVLLHLVPKRWFYEVVPSSLNASHSHRAMGLCLFLMKAFGTPWDVHKIQLQSRRPPPHRSRTLHKTRPRPVQEITFHFMAAVASSSLPIAVTTRPLVSSAAREASLKDFNSRRALSYRTFFGLGSSGPQESRKFKDIRLYPARLYTPLVRRGIVDH